MKASSKKPVLVRLSDEDIKELEKRGFKLVHSDQLPVQRIMYEYELEIVE